MAKGDVYCNDILLAEFNGGGTVYFSAHTATPGAGDQTTSELTTTHNAQYVRKALTKDGTNFVVSGKTVTLGVDVEFDEMLSGTGATVTYFAVGTASTGAGKVLRYVQKSPSLALAVNGVLRIKAGTTFTEA